jgi:hypothetical protein
MDEDLKDKLRKKEILTYSRRNKVQFHHLKQQRKFLKQLRLRRTFLHHLQLARKFLHLLHHQFMTCFHNLHHQMKSFV